MLSFGFLRVYDISWGVFLEGDSRGNTRFSKWQRNYILQMLFQLPSLFSHAMQCFLFTWQNLWWAFRNCPSSTILNVVINWNTFGITENSRKIIYITSKIIFNCEPFREKMILVKHLWNKRKITPKHYFCSNRSKAVASKVTKVALQLVTIYD